MNTHIEELQTSFDTLLEGAKQSLLRDGKFPMTVTGFNNAKQSITFHPPQCMDKENFYGFATAYLALEKCDAYMLIDEAWFRVFEKGECQHTKVSQDPRRQECFMALLVTREHVRNVILKMLRDDDGKLVKLEPYHDETNPKTKHDGAAASLLLPEGYVLPDEVKDLTYRYVAQHAEYA